MRRIFGLATAFGAACLSLMSGAASAAPANATAVRSAPTHCAGVMTIDLMGLQDAPTQLVEAKAVAAVEEAPAHCNVQGYVAPQVGFELMLPDLWNGKFLEVGCGGYCGSTRRGTARWCLDALRRGYACIVSDQGHVGPGALWAYNNLPAELDYGVRAAHVAAIVGKALVQHYYDAAPRKSYFMGCSGGGRQGLVEAQRFPWDFDGVIAIDPSNLTCTGLSLLWNGLANTDKGGGAILKPADLKLLNRAAIAACDRDDGLEDGVIGDPRTCRFAPEALICKRGASGNCLTPAQVEAARKIYGGPVTSRGERLSHAAMPGSETGYMFTRDLQYKLDYWRFMGFMPDPGPSWQARDFDFDKDYKRLGTMEALYAADNPDLRRFKANGAKLLLVQGWDDSGSPLPLNTLDYYEAVERAMGGRAATQSFARLFMIPGKAHCTGGAGANAIDYLSYLEAWVEEGRAPDVMIGTHVRSDDPADFVRAPAKPDAGAFTRPHYPYPAQARYRGTGDPNDHRSFAPVTP